MFRNEFDHKDIKRWPIRFGDFFRSLNGRFAYNVGRMDTDGVISPNNEPVLVKRERFTVSQASASAVTVTNLATWLEIETAQLKDYEFSMRITPDLANGTNEDADFYVALNDGAADRSRWFINDIGDIPTTRDSNFHLDFAALPGYILTADFSGYSTGTTITFITVFAYRLPSSVCV